MSDSITALLEAAQALLNAASCNGRAPTRNEYRTSGLGSPFEALSAALAEALRQRPGAQAASEPLPKGTEWGDKDDEWTPLIDAAHPMQSGAHDEYAKALAMVGNRRSKGALVELVCWLLQSATPAGERPAAQAEPMLLACGVTDLTLPDGVMFDAFGHPRVRYVRVMLEGATCVMTPPEAEAYKRDAEHFEDRNAYQYRDVYLSQEEFDALPEFDGF